MSEVTLLAKVELRTRFQVAPNHQIHFLYKSWVLIIPDENAGSSHGAFEFGVFAIK